MMKSITGLKAGMSIANSLRVEAHQRGSGLHGTEAHLELRDAGAWEVAVGVGSSDVSGTYPEPSEKTQEAAGTPSNRHVSTLDQNSQGEHTSCVDRRILRGEKVPRLHKSKKMKKHAWQKRCSSCTTEAGNSALKV